MVFLIIAAALILLFAIFLFLTAPNVGRKDRMKPFEKQYIAHRGLYDNETDAPENSLPAFRLAVENGYGIELDLQTTTDGRLVVFHDANLERICGVDKMLYDCSYDELMQLSLAKSKERIPLFSEVLELVDGRVPLIVEIKGEGDWKKTTELAAFFLDNYKGLYCVESFHFGAVHWYRKHRPNVIRGQLSLDYFKWHSKQPWIAKLALSDLWMNFLSRPDFIAYDHRQAYRLSYRIVRSLFPVENVAWTVQSQQELEKARKIFHCFIFDSFIPDADKADEAILKERRH